MAQLSNTRKKVLAVLAGGLVLGVGAAVTLAAWNDSEFASGTFTAGSFNLEGSTTSATAGFDDHNIDDGDNAETLNFTLDASNLAPEESVYAPFWVRLDAATTSPATLTAAAPSVTGTNAANLAYTVSAIDAGASCNATTAADGTVIASGTDLNDFVAGTGLALADGAAGVAGAAAQLCFVVTAGADLQPAVTTTATWEFTAESN